MELKTQNDIKESELIRESREVEELLVTQCPPTASDAQILQRIRAGVAAARRTHRCVASCAHVHGLKLRREAEDLRDGAQDTDLAAHSSLSSGRTAGTFVRGLA